MNQQELEAQFAGVRMPEEMGTTGLVAWVVAGPGGVRTDSHRVAKAVSIIRRRKGDTAGFARAVLKLLTNQQERDRYAGYLDACGCQGALEFAEALGVVAKEEHQEIIGHCDGCGREIPDGDEDYRRGEEGMIFCGVCVRKDEAREEQIRQRELEKLASENDQ